MIKPLTVEQWFFLQNIFTLLSNFLMTSGTFSLLKLGSIIDDNGFHQMGTDTLAGNVSPAEKIDAIIFLS